jgi:hypothetical protein
MHMYTYKHTDVYIQAHTFIYILAACGSQRRLAGLLIHVYTYMYTYKHSHSPTYWQPVVRREDSWDFSQMFGNAGAHQAQHQAAILQQHHLRLAQHQYHQSNAYQHQNEQHNQAQASLRQSQQINTYLHQSELPLAQHNSSLRQIQQIGAMLDDSASRAHSVYRGPQSGYHDANGDSQHVTHAHGSTTDPSKSPSQQLKQVQVVSEALNNNTQASIREHEHAQNSAKTTSRQEQPHPYRSHAHTSQYEAERITAQHVNNSKECSATSARSATTDESHGSETNNHTQNDKERQNHVLSNMRYAVDDDMHRLEMGSHTQNDDSRRQSHVLSNARYATVESHKHEREGHFEPGGAQLPQTQKQLTIPGRDGHYEPANAQSVSSPTERVAHMPAETQQNHHVGVLQPYQNGACDAPERPYHGDHQSKKPYSDQS